MSNRSLLEFNHDYAGDIKIDSAAFLETLRRYLNSADQGHAAALERFGVKRISFRHHSEAFYIDEGEDGFPARYSKRQETARG